VAVKLPESAPGRQPSLELFQPWALSPLENSRLIPPSNQP
jgi:hypothetical protein